MSNSVTSISTAVSPQSSNETTTSTRSTLSTNNLAGSTPETSTGDLSGEHGDSPASPPLAENASAQPQPGAPPPNVRADSVLGEIGQSVELDDLNNGRRTSRTTADTLHNVNGGNGSNASTTGSPAPQRSATGRWSSISSLIVQSSIGSTTSTTFTGLGITVRSNEDGTQECSFKLSKLIWFFCICHIIIIGYALTSLYFEILGQYSANPPNIAEQHIEIMEKIFGLQAHEDAKNILAAIQQKNEEEEAKWEGLKELLNSCWDHQHGTDVNGTDCETALHNFNRRSVPLPANPEVARRKSAEIAHWYGKRAAEASPEPVSSTLSHIPPVVFVPIIAVLLMSIVFSLLWYFRVSILAKLKLLRKQREARLDEIFTEKDWSPNFTDTDSTAIGATSVDQQDESGLTRRRLIGGTNPNDIHAAAAQGYVDEVERILSDDPSRDLNEVHPRYGSVLSAAARNGNARLVARLTGLGASADIIGGHFHTTLQAAADSGNAETVRLLIQAKASDVPGGYHGSAFNAAAEKGDASMLATLLQQEPDKAKACNQTGGTFGLPIIAAAARGNSQIVRILLANGADVNRANDTKSTALHEACRRGNLELVKELLASGSSISHVSDSYGSPLHVAVKNGHGDVAQELVNTGADIYLRNTQDRLALHEAASLGLTAVAKAILAQDKTLVDAQDRDSNTALHLASIGGHADIVALLLSYDASVSLGDKFKAQPLFRAAGCHHPAIVKMLLDKDADPNARDCFERTALHGPAQSDDVSVHRMLIAAGADVNVVGNDKKTPLHEACNMGRINNVVLLLAQPDVKINEIDNDQFTPLYRALCSTDNQHLNKCINPNVVHALLDQADIDVNLCTGIAIQEAARKGMTDVVARMVERGGSLHVHGGKYGSVLTAAAISGNMELIQFLLEPKRHVNVNQIGGEMGTPLAAAAAFGHVAVVELLLESGAEPSLKISSEGRYGSVWNSVGRQIEEPERSRGPTMLEQDYIRELLRRAGGDEVMMSGRDSKGRILASHETDRWLLSPGGWVWAPPGEM